LIANKLDGSKSRRTHGHPTIDDELENLVVRMVKENPSWGYDGIVGALANLGHKLSDQTVGNILGRHDLPPAPKRQDNDRLIFRPRCQNEILFAVTVLNCDTPEFP
jgi:putative transposase